MSASSARDQVARLLTLVPYLYARDEVRVDEAADLLGTTPAQVVKDMWVLFMCGLPDGLPDDLIDVDTDALDEGVIRVSNADYLARPLRLTQVEASAMIVALRALRAGASADTRVLADRLLAKLETAAAEAGAAARVDPGEDPTDAALDELTTRLEKAVADRRQVRLSYYVPTRDEQSERVVDPRRVISEGGHRYLDAWCHSAEAPRWFRLDRIQSAEVLAAEVSVADGDERPRPIAPSMFAQSTEHPTATLRLAPEAAWVTEYYPILTQRPLPDGRIEVDLPVADPRWLQRLVLRLAPSAEVVGPQEFAESSTMAAREALRLYG